MGPQYVHTFAKCIKLLLDLLELLKPKSAQNLISKILGSNNEKPCEKLLFESAHLIQYNPPGETCGEEMDSWLTNGSEIRALKR